MVSTCLHAATCKYAILWLAKGLLLRGWPGVTALTLAAAIMHTMYLEIQPWVLNKHCVFVEKRPNIGGRGRGRRGGGGGRSEGGGGRGRGASPAHEALCIKARQRIALISIGSRVCKGTTGPLRLEPL